MEKRSSFEKPSISGRNNSYKDLSVSHGSIKSTKSVDNQNTGNSVNKSISNEPEKALLNKGCEKKITVSLDGSTKIPHKFIANWRLACDRTKDRTRELLKRWKTLSEFEGIEHAQHELPKEQEKTADEQHDKSGWSVHIWSRYFHLYILTAH